VRTARLRFGKQCLHVLGDDAVEHRFFGVPALVAELLAIEGGCAQVAHPPAHSQLPCQRRGVTASQIRGLFRRRGRSGLQRPSGIPARSSDASGSASEPMVLAQDGLLVERLGIEAHLDALA
jgi:hypothetical protein